MLLEERVQARFVEFVVVARVMVAVKPFSAARDMEEVAVAPALAVTLPGLAAIVKSGDDGCVTDTEILVVWESEPLVPMIVIV